MCECCEEIEFWKKEKNKESCMNSKIFAKIAVYTWLKGEWENFKNAKGKITTKPYELNYCPMCGKELKWSLE